MNRITAGNGDITMKANKVSVTVGGQDVSQIATPFSDCITSGGTAVSSFVVVNGDKVNFESTFGTATLVPPLTTTITGTGSKLTSGAIACVEGDESSVTLAGVPYSATPFLGGTGTLTIKQLASDQLAQKLTVGSKNAILIGSKFDATFTVTSPALNSSGSSDPTLTYSGKGSFSTSDSKLKST